MSDAPVAREAADAADVRAIDVADAADASAEALAEALADAPVVQVEDAVGLARLRLLGDEPAPFEADLPEARVAVEDSDNAVLRSGLAEAVEVEQFSTTRWGDLARNTVTTMERADPPRAPRPVFDRPGDFAKGPGFDDPRGWPADKGASGDVWDTIVAFWTFMWRYQGSRGCWHQIAMQCYLAIYPMLRSLYAAWIVDQASRDRTWFLIKGDNAPLARLGGLAASYFLIYVLKLAADWRYGQHGVLGALKQDLRQTLMLKQLRLRTADRLPAGDAAALLGPIVDDAAAAWGTFFELSPVALAFCTQLGLLLYAAQQSVSLGLVAGPVLLLGVLAFVFKRKRTLFAEATAAVVRVTEALYASIQARAGTVPDGNLDEARAEAETFSVAVFCYQKRCGVRYFLSMEMEQEFGLLAHFIVAGALFYMGWSVLEEDLTAAQFLLIYNVLKDAESTMEGVADKLKELPQAYAAIKTIADVLNAGDVGDDEVVAKAATEDVWTRGKRALLAFAHREPAEAPAKPQDDEGFLARVRGAGKRLVG